MSGPPIGATWSEWMCAVAKASLNSRIVEGLGGELKAHGPLREVPFVLELAGLGTVAFYAFTLTSPVGGRPTGEYKVQLIVPGQARGTRGKLSLPPGAFTIVAGWSPEEDVFALWDAYAHRSFAYSQNLQVKGQSVWLARAQGLSTCERRLRGGRGVEIVVVCRADCLADGIRERVRFSARRLEASGGS